MMDPYKSDWYSNVLVISAHLATGYLQLLQTLARSKVYKFQFRRKWLCALYTHYLHWKTLVVVAVRLRPWPCWRQPAHPATWSTAMRHATADQSMSWPGIITFSEPKPRKKTKQSQVTLKTALRIYRHIQYRIISLAWWHPHSNLQ